MLRNWEKIMVTFLSIAPSIGESLFLLFAYRKNLIHSVYTMQVGIFPTSHDNRRIHTIRRRVIITIFISSRFGHFFHQNALYSLAWLAKPQLVKRSITSCIRMIKTCNILLSLFVNRLCIGFSCEIKPK